MLLNKGTTQIFLLKNLNKFAASTPSVIQIKYFSSSEIGKRYPKQFDYKNKSYNLLSRLYDPTINRLSDNSLIITVDGNFGSGKSEFAKELAKSIDFIYASEIDTIKMLYTRRDNGANLRDIVNGIVDDKEQYRINSIDEWHQNPLYKRSIQIQCAYYKARWLQYRSALLHLFSTGQGVVLERSPFSDQVIAQALYEENLLSKEAFNYYKNDYVKQTLCELWKPHVMIYLDRSPENCLNTIKEKGKDYEKNSKAYTLNLLNNVDKIYKKSFLPVNSKDAYILNYNNNNKNEKIVIEEVIADLESLDLDDLTHFPDWRIRKPRNLDSYRLKLSNDEYVEKLFNGIRGYINVPELLIYGEEYKTLKDRLVSNPKIKNDVYYSDEKNSFAKAFDLFTNIKKPNVDYL